VVSSGDFPGCIAAAAIAAELGLPAPKPETVLLCSDKYYSRLAQREVVPEATPTFSLIDREDLLKNQLRVEFPIFIKPVKSWFSVLARRVENIEELTAFLAQPTVKRFKSKYLYPFDRLMKTYTQYKSKRGHFLAEQIMEGSQVTIEGFAFHGTVEIISIVDSVMYPDTISFQRFEYPSSLSEDVQDVMKSITKKVIRHIGFDNGLFNIEMFYNPETGLIQIIEINPRMVGQFADLMEKVDGTNTYEILLALCIGEKPIVRKAKGKFRVAASFALRSFEDKRVVRVPNERQVGKVKKLFPGTTVHMFFEAGEKLSDYEHEDDLQSYCYAAINMGAADRNSLLAAFGEVQKHLVFSFDSAD